MVMVDVTVITHTINSKATNVRPLKRLMSISNHYRTQIRVNISLKVSNRLLSVGAMIRCALIYTARI